MSHQLTMNLIWIGYYLAWIVWVALTVIFIVASVRKKWPLVKRTLKYVINSIVFIIAFSFIVELQVIVRPEILPTKQESITALQKWIIERQVNDVYFAIAAITFLFAVNLFFYYKIESKKHRHDLSILTLTAVIILSVSIWLAGKDAYFGLLEEINRHFV